MSQPARNTQAEIERAIKAAKAQGCPSIKLPGGIVIMLLDDQKEADKVNPADLLGE